MLVRKAMIISTLCFSTLTFLVACDRGKPNPFTSRLEGEWQTRGQDGTVERVAWGPKTVTYRQGETEEEYECPYYVESYHPDKRTLVMHIDCGERIGVPGWATYDGTVNEEISILELFVNGRLVETFTRADNG